MYFYLPCIDVGKIEKAHSGHFLSCRIKAGDIIWITDLQGNLARIQIRSVDLKSGTYLYDILEKSITTKPDSKKNILLQAQTEKLYLEKLMEIVPLANIDEIYIFPSDLSQKQNLSLDRLERILIRSCEQSQKTIKPGVNFIDKSELKNLTSNLQPVVLDIATTSNANVNTNKQNTDQVSTRAILVGPEGGWSTKELEFFKGQNLRFASLGSTVYPAWIAGFTWFSTNNLLS